MAQTQSERLAAIHQQALQEFEEIQSAMKDGREQCLQDRRFYSITGAQWEGALGDQFENRPKFEVNKVHLAVIRIINEYKNNRITVDFLSKNGLHDDDLADACDGLYRADEEDSGAQEAYDNAFEEAVGGGFGAWRLRADLEDEDEDEKEDEENERQRIYIEPIYDADSSVFFDLQAKRQDKRDATRCFVITSMTRSAYEEMYDDNPATWPKEVSELEFDWATPDVVYVAEYYRVEETTELFHVYQGLDEQKKYIKDSDVDSEEMDILRATGFIKIGEKRKKRKIVNKYIFSGIPLEDCGRIAGRSIPIVPAYGKRWFIDNIERCMGHVRLAKDAQRLANILRTKLGEISAGSSIEKPILTPEQIAGHQDMWENDAVSQYAYLLINTLTDINGGEIISGPVAYTKSADVPPSLAALLQITEQDLKDLLGNPEQGEKMVSNIAEHAVEMIQNRLDMQTFVYVDNMAKAVKRSGEIWLDMARDIYIEEGREMETVGLQGERETISLMQPTTDSDGNVIAGNDISKAKFKVISEAGPSSSTKRQATVRNLVRMAAITDDQETKQVLGAMAMMNMEGEGIGDVRQYFRRKLIALGVVEPTEKEAEDLAKAKQGQQPSAQDQYLMAAAANEQMKAVKAQSQIVSEQADTDKTRAETAEIIAKIDLDQLQMIMDLVEKLGPNVSVPGVPPETSQSFLGPEIIG